MAATIIESLITQLGFDFDEENIKAFNKGVENAEKLLIGVAAAGVAAAVGILAFTNEIAGANDETGKLSERIGVDIEAMQELGYVAELNGGSINSMNSSLENLSKIASEAARGVGAGAETFGILGLSVTDAEGRIKSADNLLLEISDSVAALGTQAEKLEFTQKLGIGSDLLLGIQNGSEAMMRQREEAKKLGFAIDKDAAGAAANFNDEMLRVKKIVQGVASTIGTKLMKVLTPVIKIFTEWFKLNRAFIQQGLEKFFTTMVDVLNAFFNISARVFGIINTVVQAFGGWENAIALVTGALVLLNATALFIPFLLFAVGAAVLLLIEDLQTLANGGDSWLGDMLGDFPLLLESLKLLMSWLGKIAEGWKLLFSDELGNAIEGVGIMINDIIAWVMNLDDVLIGLLNKIPGINIGEQTNPVPIAAAGSSGSVSNNSTTSNTSNPNISIKIDGGNPAEVRKTVTEVLNEQYTGANTNLTSEVDY